MEVVYEDNHLIIVNKACGEIVQGDRTGDEPLVETLKRWIKEKYQKPGNVFCGVTHRIDRPTCGLVVFARTSKGLSRMNAVSKGRREQNVLGDCEKPSTQANRHPHELPDFAREGQPHRGAALTTRRRTEGGAELSGDSRGRALLPAGGGFAHRP